MCLCLVFCPFPLFSGIPAQLIAALPPDPQNGLCCSCPSRVQEQCVQEEEEETFSWSGVRGGLRERVLVAFSFVSASRDEAFVSRMDPTCTFLTQNLSLTSLFPLSSIGTAVEQPLSPLPRLKQSFAHSFCRSSRYLFTGVGKGLAVPASGPAIPFCGRVREHISSRHSLVSLSLSSRAVPTARRL